MRLWLLLVLLLVTVFSCGTIGNGGGNNNDEDDDVLPDLPTGAIDVTFVLVNREPVLLLLFVFAADVAFDKCGFNVFEISHIFDSVVLTGLSFDAGLLGSHIAAICSVDNIVLLPADAAGDDDGWVDADGGDDG